MTTIGIIGSGHVGSNLAKAAIAHGYDVVLSSSQGPESGREFLDPAALRIGYRGHGFEQHQRQAELAAEAQVHRSLELSLDAPHVSEHPPQVSHVDLVP